MEKRSDSPFPRKDRPVLAAVGVVLVVSTVLFAWSDRRHDWRWYQYDFRRQVAETALLHRVRPMYASRSTQRAE